MMKYLTVLLLCALLGPGGKIQILKSTSQEWIGGLQESGYGTEYKMIIKVKAGSDQLQVEDLWIGDKHVKFRLMTDPANPLNKSFIRGSEITLKAAVTYRPGPDERALRSGADSVAKPFNFKGQGLLGYSYKGKRAYMEISEFRKLEKLIYP
jgi:hypothetical protein